MWAIPFTIAKRPLLHVSISSATNAPVIPASITSPTFSVCNAGVPPALNFVFLWLEVFLVLWFHEPDIAALWFEEIEQQPFTIRRPDRIIDPHRRMIELEY